MSSSTHKPVESERSLEKIALEVVKSTSVFFTLDCAKCEANEEFCCFFYSTKMFIVSVAKKCYRRLLDWKKLARATRNSHNKRNNYLNDQIKNLNLETFEL